MMRSFYSFIHFSHALRWLLAAALLLTLTATGRAAPDGRVPLSGHHTSTAAAGRMLGFVAPAQPIALTLALAPRNTQGLNDLLRRLYDPHDPLYRRFLTPEQFAARFCPTPRQYAAVAAFARSQGMTVTGGAPNRLLLHVQAPTSTVEAAFGVQLRRFLSAHGREFHAPASEPTVPVSIAPLLIGVIGLDNSAVWKSHAQPLTALPDARMLAADPLSLENGPNGGLSPAAIQTAYGLGGLPASADGSGQTLGLFELDGYNPSDITAYENYFGLPQVPLQNVPVDGGSGPLGSGQAEVTLDIELQAAVAPGANKILVYEGPNNNQGLLDTYNQIALDDQAQQISTSWGISEDQAGASFVSAESTIFQEMAAQGQTLYAASGDSGAYDDGSTLSVDDPASQPDVTGTGGTSLSVGAGASYGSETAWSSGGGGVSALWAIPSWQQPVIGPTSGASSTMRNVPDVSLDADPYTGYAIYLNGGWVVYGGTSCASPIWAAFTALVNQQRAATGEASLGFANPILYAIGAGQFGTYASDFHDITSGNNGYYSAGLGYDDATGLGSFNGANLLTDLAAAPMTVKPTGLTATAGNLQVALSWKAVPGAASYNVYRSTTSGGESGTTPIQTGTTTTACTDTHVTGGTQYYYEVTAVNVSGESGFSNEASAVPFGPIVTVAAAANPATVTAKSTSLSVQAQDAPGQTLTYTWVATGTPPAPVSFSPNASSTANAATATFAAAGSYPLTVTVTDSRGLTTSSAVTVTVQQTPTSLSVSPAHASVAPSGTQQFTASVKDQFGAALTSTITSAPTWSVSGGGTISSAGLFTASSAPGGSYTVTAAQGAASATAAVTVTAPSATSTIRYAPRVGWEQRMVGGQFQGSTDGTSYVTLYTVASAPPAGQWTSVTLPLDLTQYRYLRYLAPDGAYGNVAEVEFDGPSGKLTGTGFGTAGSWSNDGNVFGNALDGDLSTFFDAPAPGNGDFVGIDRGAGTGGAAPVTSTIRYAPRVGWEQRMVGGQFQASNDGVNYTTLTTVTQTPPAGQWTSVTLPLDLTQYRFLRYLAPDGAYGNVAEVEFDSNGVKMTGAGFGTAGSWSGDGNVFSNALDGDLSTFFDAPAPGNGDFVGIDRGAGTGGAAPVTSTIRYAPRVGWEQRMVGGQFQGSTDGTSYVTLYTVASAPPAGQWTSVTLPLDLTQYRYLRYLAPDGAYGNVAEVEFDGPSGKLTGTGFGTAGSWSNDGNVFGNALDGDLSTFFDAPAPGNGDFVGIQRY